MPTATIRTPSPSAERAAVVLGTEGLTLDDVWEIAVLGRPLTIGVGVLERLAAGRVVVDRMLANGHKVYGLTTNFGAGRNTPIEADDLAAWQHDMVRAHAGALGQPLEAHEVRAQIAVRLAGAAAGGSGLHSDTFLALVALLNSGVVPYVPAIGSVGASDLMHCAAVAEVLIGEGWAFVNGRLMPGQKALARAGLAPVQLHPKDGLALLSANAYSIGVGALTVQRARRLADLADEVVSLTIEVLGANPSPFDEEVALAKPFEGQIASAERVRWMLEGSHLFDPLTALSVQDPLSVRTVPQVHGAFREQVASTAHAVQVEVNAIDDNPMVSLASGRTISNGNFHPIVMALGFDHLRVAAAHVGLIAERRIQQVNGPLPATSRAQRAATCMTRKTLPGHSVYAAAALVAQLRHLANPITLNAPPLGQEVEDHATLAPSAVQLAEQSLDVLEQLLSLELVLAADVAHAEGRRLAPRTNALAAVVDAALCDCTDPPPGSVALTTVITALRTRVQ